MKKIAHHEEVTRLLSKLLDEGLDEAERGRLQERLETDPEARRLYLQYVDNEVEFSCLVVPAAGAEGEFEEDLADLAEPGKIERFPSPREWERESAQRKRPPEATGGTGPGEGGAGSPQAARERASWRGRRWWMASAALFVATLGLAALLLSPGEDGTAATGGPRLGALAEVSGSVLVKAPDGRPRPVAPGAEIAPGSTVRTRGGDSAATFAYKDGTQMELAPDTAVTVDRKPGKSVFLHGGRLAASVTPQPNGEPMVLETPLARVRVVGTAFTLVSEASATVLTVTEGLVRLTRLADGVTQEVAAGFNVVVRRGGELLLQRNPAPPDTWEETFAQGLPDGWVSGEFVAKGLPGSSRGAVGESRTVLGNAVYHQIATPVVWPRGIFTIQPDSHLTLRLKMDEPDSVNLLMFTRPRFKGGPAQAFYKFDRLPVSQLQPGRWARVTVPLAAFRRKGNDGFTGGAPAAGEVVVQLAFRSDGAGRGLVIDRIAAGRGGPGATTVEPLE